jgi:hypothetical protein
MVVSGSSRSVGPWACRRPPTTSGIPAAAVYARSRTSGCSTCACTVWRRHERLESGVVVAAVPLFVVAERAHSGSVISLRQGAGRAMGADDGARGHLEVASRFLLEPCCDERLDWRPDRASVRTARQRPHALVRVRDDAPAARTVLESNEKLSDAGPRRARVGVQPNRLEWATRSRPRIGQGGHLGSVVK